MSRHPSSRPSNYEEPSRSSRRSTATPGNELVPYGDRASYAPSRDTRSSRRDTVGASSRSGGPSATGWGWSGPNGEWTEADTRERQAAYERACIENDSVDREAEYQAYLLKRGFAPDGTRLPGATRFQGLEWNGKQWNGERYE